jgi:hypothetical protein
VALTALGDWAERHADTIMEAQERAALREVPDRREAA